MTDPQIQVIAFAGSMVLLLALLGWWEQRNYRKGK